MRLVCAWCQKDISTENSSGEISQDISYGICPTCRARFFPDLKDLPPAPEQKKKPAANVFTAIRELEAGLRLPESATPAP